MRHRKRGRILNVTSAHRRAMGRNIIASLFERFGTEKEFVYTTKPKAKEFRPLAERLITMAKRGTQADRRRAASLLHNEAIVKKLFEEIAPRYKDRPGGYTRILKTERRRLNDGSDLVLFGLLGPPEKEEKKQAKKKPLKKAAAEQGGAGAPEKSS